MGRLSAYNTGGYPCPPQLFDPAGEVFKATRVFDNRVGAGYPVAFRHLRADAGADLGGIQVVAVLNPADHLFLGRRRHPHLVDQVERTVVGLGKVGSSHHQKPIE